MKKEAVILFLFIITILLGFLLLGNGITGMVVVDQDLDEICQGADCGNPELNQILTQVKEKEENNNYLMIGIGAVILVAIIIAGYLYITHHDIMVKFKREYY